MAERLFLDTNVFLRYLTNDLPDQADAVEGLLRRAGRGEVRLVTNALVIAEIVWTLESYYHLTPPAIRDQVLAVANTPGLALPERDLLIQAAVWYAERNVDFIDAYNAAWVMSEGIGTVCTFDRRHFSRFDHLQAQGPDEG